MSLYKSLLLIILILNSVINLSTAQMSSVSASVVNLPSSIISKNNETFQLTKTNMSICATGDKLSSRYCQCKEKVTSCDFSSYPGSMENRTELKIFVDEMEQAAKRLCICGGPKHVLLNITRKINEDEMTSTMMKMENKNNLGFLHRVDIYNISGPLHITEAFQTPFGGDFYLSKVNHLYSLRAEQFKRGNDFKIEDVQDLECCSEIKVSQNHSKPTLYMDSSRIGDIYSRSISSYHVWRTIILKNLTIRTIHQRGIALEYTNEHVNMSIINCKFNNITSKGIVVQGFHTLFMAKNTFHESCAADAVDAWSTVENSSLIVLDNYFDNAMVLDMNAHRVLNWFNFYNVWDNWTFAYYQEQPFSDSIYSIEYNTVKFFTMKENDINFNSTLVNSTAMLLTREKVVFHENVVGSCNCSIIHGTHLPPHMNTSRCDSVPFDELSTKSTKPSESCLVDLNAVMNVCTDESKVLNPSQLCKTHGIKKPSFSQNKMKKMAFKATGFKIVSPFVSEMMKELKFQFFIHQVFSHSEESEESEEKQYSHHGDDDDDEENENNNPSHVGLVIILVLFSISISVGAVVLLIKQRRLRRSFMGTSHLSESYDILTTST